MRLTPGQVDLLARAEAGYIWAYGRDVWLVDRPFRQIAARVHTLVGKGLLRRVEASALYAKYVLTDAGRAELCKRRRP